MLSAGAVYYHSLKQFASLFRLGLPILTYHKLGPRPSGTRLKGLYVSERLFVKQLEELKQAGFRAASLTELSGIFTKKERAIVLTFDDGFRNAFELGLGPLAKHHFRAVQFLVAGQLGKTNEWEVVEGEAPAPLMDGAQVKDWLAAGRVDRC